MSKNNFIIRHAIFLFLWSRNVTIVCVQINRKTKATFFENYENTKIYKGLNVLYTWHAYTTVRERFYFNLKLKYQLRRWTKKLDHNVTKPDRDY